MLNRIVFQLRKILSWMLYSVLMRKFHFGSVIIKPMLIKGYKNIDIGKNVLIRNYARIEVVQPQNDSVIVIGNNVNIEQNVHIIGRCKIVIGNNVTITPNCSIVDVIHPYEDIWDETKIGNRISDKCKPVIIGEGTFIGTKSHVNPGVIIGKHCIIGANSVVTSNLPDYTVATGAPAKIIRKFSAEENKWIKVE